MTPRCVRFVVFAATVSLLIGPAAALAGQSTVERELDQAKALYGEGRFDEAIPRLLSVVAQLRDLREMQRGKIRLADAHLFLGLSYFAMRDEANAAEHFRQVVAFDPDRTLDAEIFSPRVITLFERVRSERVDAAAKPGPAPQPAGPEARPDAAAPSPSNPPPSGLFALQVGTKMRVGLTSRENVRGHLLTISESAITLVNDDNRNLAFPRASVARIYVAQGKRNHLLRAVIAGAAFGAFVGAFETPSGPACQKDCWTRGENIGYGSLGMALVGAVVGSYYKTDRWVEVPLNRLAGTQAPSTAGGPRD